MGILGFGHLGQFLYNLLEREQSKSEQKFELVFIWNRSVNVFKKYPEINKQLIVETVQEGLQRLPDLVIEVAHPDVIEKYGIQILDVCDLFIGSPTAFADDHLEKLLRKKTMDSSHSIYVGAGACWGAEDISKMCERNILKTLCITMKKHPDSLKLNEPLRTKLTENLEIEGEVILYDGPIREVCHLAPNNVNTMAICAILAPNLGFDGVQGKLVADKKLFDRHIIEIELWGPDSIDKNKPSFHCKTIRTNPADIGHRKVQVQQTPSLSPTPAKIPKQEQLKSQRTLGVPEDDIIRSRLLYEGDMGIDDRRILTLMKTYHRWFHDSSTTSDDSIEKLLSSLYAIEHSYTLSQTTLKMDKYEQLCYEQKNSSILKHLEKLRIELDLNEKHLIKAKDKRLHLLEYDRKCIDIDKYPTRKELKTQIQSVLERKQYFERLLTTFDSTYHLRLKQIAIYMKPIFELDLILREDTISVDSDTEEEQSTIIKLSVPITTAEKSSKQSSKQSKTSSTTTPKASSHKRTNSDSSAASMEDDVPPSSKNFIFIVKQMYVIYRTICTSSTLPVIRSLLFSTIRSTPSTIFKCSPLPIGSPTKCYSTLLFLNKSFLFKQHTLRYSPNQLFVNTLKTLRNRPVIIKSQQRQSHPNNPVHPPDYVPPSTTSAVKSQSSILQRFRQAYAKYGKILIAVHFVTSWMWISGLIFIHVKGLDLGMYIMNGLVYLNVITDERRTKFVQKLNDFQIISVIKKLPLLTEDQVTRLNDYFTGERLRLLATAVLLYKFLTPIRYATSLGVTAFLSKNLLKRGVLKRAPQGDTLKELYHDQKQLIGHNVRRAKDHIRNRIKRRTRRGKIAQ
ncbi:unnamed protein product [Didymodactylos carnosus]|uniref:Aspartate dehydrogenase domain-containing protein n=1 Tax=Didymodactylos carnosus TaxID=1234261 RepID=A0A813TN16_9BILA|nr:unnamed protein product [Didymodactylos carnosus]CAF0919749.1 unnamed protein product [Didymodactylos carnosus]CAF3597743.1 unnamed protein product [Didymodactylos carnosus]CAF3697400.1 unnamed protein product [Didymodactylos carnosus]